MYVVKWTAKVKRGASQAMVDLLKERTSQLVGKTFRIYSNFFGDNGIVCLEIEYSDFASIGEMMERTQGKENEEEITEQGWYTLTEGMTIEVWKLHD